VLALLFVGCDLVAGHFGAPADPSDPTEIVFEVPAGSTVRGLAPALEDAGLVASRDSFTTWVRVTKEGGCIKTGRHLLRPDMSARQLVTALCGVPLSDDVPFTVVEGWRIQEIDHALVEAGLAAPGAYTAAAQDPDQFHASFSLPQNTLEGYLFPETYRVDQTRFTVEGLIQRQLDLFDQRFVSQHEPAELDVRGLGAVVIMASMIEREEPGAKLRPLVAGILWKRLDSGWNLGVDATSRYKLDHWNDRQAFLKKLRDPTDPYNTRLRAGLPPTAIGNPSVSSLEAALAPVASDYWYYLHDSSKTLHPARTVAEHQANRRRYQVY